MAVTQRATQPYATQAAKLVATHATVTRNFARSINFSSLAATLKALDTSPPNIALEAQHWEDALGKAIDSSALRDALAATASLGASSAMNQVMEGFKQRSEALAQMISQRITSPFADIDLTSWLDPDRWLPSNLCSIQDHDLDVVAAVALDEGIPLSWVPRAEIVVALIEADGPQERSGILTGRRDDIIDDCESVLAPISHEWAVQCHSAVVALRQGLHGPAQSHASNLVDSIVLEALDRRDTATDLAQDDFVDLPLGFVAENLTLRPLVRAFVPWYPRSDTSPPPHFARHATSHAVGQTGVFDPLYALVGIMLATSLTVQFSS